MKQTLSSPSSPQKNIFEFLRSVPLTHDVFEFHFRVPNFQFLPGQFVTLKMNDEQGVFMRCYSVKAYEDGVLQLCIKLLPGGRGSAFLQSLSAGKKIEISQGIGTFVLASGQNPKIFIATGTGIAPMMAMLSRDSESQKTVLFGVRTESDIFYTRELQSFPNTSASVILSRPSEDWNGLKGRVTDLLDTLEVTPNTEIYICGNSQMIEDTLKFFREKNHPESHLFCEHFQPPRPPQSR